MSRLRSLQSRISTINTASAPVPTGEAYDAMRGSAYSRGYDRKWRKLRNRHLAEHPLCRICEAENRVTAATEVDHIEPISRSPERRLDPTNLQSLCHPHHVAKTAREG